MFLNDMSTIVRYSHAFLNRNLSISNITYAENYILMYLFSHEGATQEDIAGYFDIDKGSISKSIQKLERKRYIVKKKSEEDKRKNIIYLSNLGKERFAECRGLLDRWNEIVLHDVTQNELDIMKEILSRMANNIKKI